MTERWSFTRGSEPVPGSRVICGNVVTMDERRPRADAVAIVNGRIVAVGTADEALAACPAGTELVHAPGAAIIPGLIDAHVHMLWEALDTRRLSLTGVRSVAEALDSVARYAAAEPPGAWLQGSADFDLDDLAERRFPTREELDRASGGRPLFLDRRSHDGLVNGVALGLAGVDSSTPDPVGGVIERDADGSPTGLLIERPAVELVTRAIPPPTVSEYLDGLAAVQPRYHALGITGIVDPALSPAELSAYLEARARGTLTVRTTAMPLADTTAGGEGAVERLRGVGARTGLGDEWLRIGAVKVFFDGGGSLGTALLREDWPGGEPGYRGNQTTPTETLETIARFCAAEGWSLGVHVVGGAAIDLVLDVFARVDRETPIRDLRFSLIHAYLWPSPDNIALAFRLGVIVVTQPPMQWKFGPGLVRRFGIERIGDATPVRAWLDAGVLVAGSSDGPGIPLAPLFGMWQARTRRIDGLDAPVGAHQAVTAEEAIRLYTTSAAVASFADGDRGMLRPGFLADLAAVSVDPLTAEPDALHDAEVLATVVGGATVHGEL